MDTVLMVVTVVSLALAIGMAAVAWRLLREHRLRSDARVEGLQAMAAEPNPADRFVALDDDAASEATREIRSDVRSQDSIRASSVLGMPSLVGLVVAAVALGLVGGATATYMFYRPPTSGLSLGWSGVARPLELMSLSQGSDAGTFTVTGLVQNPRDGAAMQDVTAVVYLFDRDGNYFASGKAALDNNALRPGEESPFVVRVPSAGVVSRYRIGFRSDTNGVIAHVDRRHALGASGPAPASPTPSAAIQLGSEHQP